MNNTQQAYLNGFIKRAAENGYSEDEALSLFKQAADPANDVQPGTASMISPVAGGLLAAQGLGAMIGHNYAPISDKELREEMAYSEDPSISKALKYLLVPGYFGYRQAKNQRLESAYDKYRDTQRQQNPMMGQQPQIQQY